MPPLPPNPVGAPKELEITVKFKVALPVPPPLVALIVTAKVPVTVGAPLMTPVLEFTLNPVGNPDAPKLVGLLLAAI